jgi:hypothetical protein
LDLLPSSEQNQEGPLKVADLLPNYRHQRHYFTNFFLRGNLNRENGNNTQKQFVAHGDYASTANCRTKIPLDFEGNLEFFVVLKNVYVSVPRFLADFLLGNTEWNRYVRFIPSPESGSNACFRNRN